MYVLSDLMIINNTYWEQDLYRKSQNWTCLFFFFQIILNTPLQSSVTCAIISKLRHRRNLCARRNGWKQTWTWQESYGWPWKERMDNKTSIHLQPSKSRKRSLTCAVTGCTNNEYNLEVSRDSLCEIHHLPRRD